MTEALTEGLRDVIVLEEEKWGMDVEFSCEARIAPSGGAS